MTTLQSIKEHLAAHKTRVVIAFTSLLAFGVSTASAFDFNSTELVIGQVTLLFVPILAVIVGAVPIIITLAVIGFILGLLAVILQKINIT